MERVVKGFAGYIKEKEGKPATHIILTIDEYENLLNDIRQAKHETENVIVKSKKEVSEYKLEASKIINEENRNAHKHVKSAQNDLKNLKIELDRVNDLNANLLRICKERANSKRGLNPKKIHHGYIVLDSMQHSYNIRWNGKKVITENFPCWKVRIQSPYDSSIPYETIVKDIVNDLFNTLVSSLGINRVFADISKYSREYVHDLWQNYDNFIFRTLYKANIKSGFWEIEYLVKSSITVPENMRIS